MQKRYRPNRQPRRGNAHSTSQDHNPSAPGSSITPTPNPSQASTPTPNYNHKPNRPSRHARPKPNYTSVPAHASITLGTGVSIVLKQDQPTGHQVQGIAAEVLTRGDHPRGVKVRLRDGRVGRVQSIVSEGEGVRGEESVGGADANLGRNGEEGAVAGRGGRRGGRRGGFRHVRDVREDDEYLFDETKVQESSGAGYFAALEEADARYEESRGWVGDAGERVEGTSEVVSCPVCGVFEGDESAVAHHVEEHFQDGG